MQQSSLLEGCLHRIGILQSGSQGCGHTGLQVGFGAQAGAQAGLHTGAQAGPHAGAQAGPHSGAHA